MKFVKVNIYSRVENCATMETKIIEEQACLNLGNIKYVYFFGDTARVHFGQQDYLEIGKSEWLAVIKGLEK